jgi:hypothetical protein
MQAEHKDDCSPPPQTHMMSDYEDAVFSCRNHVMTAINASGYGVIYITPDQLVDFSGGEAVISFDLSTLRHSARDWVDIWVTPYEDHLILPLTDWLPDLNGEPRRAVHVTLGVSSTGTIMTAERVENFAAGKIEGIWWISYEDFLEPSATRRDTFEIRLSKNHLKAGMPDYDFWWIDADIPALDWGQGVVQFGHHSYTPEKDCPDQDCGPNTWHWDNITLNPAVPFTIVQTDTEFINQNTPNKVIFSKPAPPNSYLRFAAHGDNVQISLNNGVTWIDATIQKQERVSDGGFNSYWMPIPNGTAQLLIRGEDTWAGRWFVRDISIFSLTQP